MVLLTEKVIGNELSDGGKTDAHYRHEDDERKMGEKHPESIHCHVQDSEDQHPLEDSLDTFESHDVISFVLKLSILQV